MRFSKFSPDFPHSAVTGIISFTIIQMLLRYFRISSSIIVVLIKTFWLSRLKKVVIQITEISIKKKHKAILMISTISTVSS